MIGTGITLLWEIGRQISSERNGAVLGLTDDAVSARIVVGVGGCQGSRGRCILRRREDWMTYHGCAVGGEDAAKAAVILALVADEAAQRLTAPKLDRLCYSIAFHSERAVGKHARQDGAAVVSAVAGFAIGVVAIVLVCGNPTLAHGMHTVGTAGNGGGHSGMASGALRDHSGVPLHLRALEVVVAMSGGKLGVSGTMAGTALHSAVAFGESIQ